MTQAQAQTHAERQTQAQLITTTKYNPTIDTNKTKTKMKSRHNRIIIPIAQISDSLYIHLNKQRYNLFKTIEIYLKTNQNNIQV